MMVQPLKSRFATRSTSIQLQRCIKALHKALHLRGRRRRAARRRAAPGRAKSPDGAKWLRGRARADEPGGRGDLSVG